MGGYSSILLIFRSITNDNPRRKPQKLGKFLLLEAAQKQVQSVLCQSHGHIYVTVASMHVNKYLSLNEVYFGLTLQLFLQLSYLLSQPDTHSLLTSSHQQLLQMLCSHFFSVMNTIFKAYIQHTM